MRKGRFSEGQIISILKQSEAGVSTADLCRQHGVSRATFYGWRKKYRGMEVEDAKPLRQLEDENRRLKTLVADLTLDKRRWSTSSQNCPEAVAEERAGADGPGRSRPQRAASLSLVAAPSIDVSLRSQGEGRRAPSATTARACRRVPTLGSRAADRRPSSRRLHGQPQANLAGLRRGEAAGAEAPARPEAVRRDEPREASGGAAGRSLGDGLRPRRVPRRPEVPGVDDRGSLHAGVPGGEVGLSVGGAGVVSVLEELADEGRKPREIQLDNEPEFRSRLLMKWCHDHGVEIRFITPGKPTQNGHIESLNGTLRNECLNEHWFTDLKDARETIEAWRKRYNSFRPHSSLGGATLEERFGELRSQSVQESVVR